MMDVCELFHCTLKELPSRMSPEEYQLWVARYSIKPWGDEVRWMAKLLGALLKTDYEKLMPFECKLDNPFFGKTIKQLRKNVLKQASTFLGMQ